MCTPFIFRLIFPQRKQSLDGLKMVVRFEVDACLPYSTASSTSLPAHPAVRKKVAKRKSTSNPSMNSLDVKIIRAGSSEVPQTHLVEFKTHSIKSDGSGNGPMKWQKTYPQLYLSQTPHVHHAFHKNGTFTLVKKFSLGQRELEDIHEDAQVGFKKLRKVLGYIRSLVLKHGTARLSLVCVGKTLSVYRIPQGESCLPEDALALFVVQD